MRRLITLIGMFLWAWLGAMSSATSLGSMGFVYDYSDQPVAVSGTAAGTGPSDGNYLYDGNLKRVKSIINGRVIYNIYNAAGQLVQVHKLAHNGEAESRTD